LQFRLTVQWVLVISGLLGLFSLAVYVGLRERLYRTLDATLWSIVETELGSAFDGPNGTLHFHETDTHPFLPNGRSRLDKFVQYRTVPEGRLWAKDPHLGVLELPLSATTRDQATQGEVVFETVQFHAAPPLRLVSLLCRERGQMAYIMQVGASLTPINTTLTGLVELLGILDFSALVFTALGGAFLARRALRPVDHLVRTVEHIESQNLHQRLEVCHPTHEIGRLALVLNRMLDRLERSFHAQQRFIADASHELRSPLTNLRLALELAGRQRRTPAEYSHSFHSALEEVDRLVRLINGLLMLTRADSGYLEMAQEPVPLHALVQRVAAEYRAQAEAKAVTLRLALPEVVVPGDSARLHQLFANLLDNALRYTPAQGQVAVVGDLLQHTVGVCVIDTGIGIAPEHLGHVCKRFYRVDKERARDDGGNGLGLAICQEIAHAHGGSLRLESTVGYGTTCTVVLPLYAPDGER
jgi:heavy metal sensor kinase